MTVCPCRDCSERQCGCHAKCEKYKGWRKEFDDQKKANLQCKNEYRRLNEYEVNKTRRLKKGSNIHKKIF